MFSVAIQAAIANPVKDLPQMAAVITYRRKVISIGLNSHKTHPLARRFAKHKLAICQHAEVAAIKNALRQDRNTDFTKTSMWIARVLRNGSPALAAPCEGCERALKAYGITDVRWTTSATLVS